MNEMNRHLKAIELDKVLNMVAERACNEDAKEAILNLRPESNLQLVADLLKKTEAAYILLAKFGGPALVDLKTLIMHLLVQKQGQCLLWKNYSISVAQ